MPEGDTLHRTAHTLGRVLEGQRLVCVRSSIPAIAHAELAGQLVESVCARGKNLLVRFDDGRVLHTHLKMLGSWHVYRPGERFQRPEHQARVILEVSDALAVCFSAPTVRLLTPQAAAQDPYLNGLGPDLIPDQFDLGQAVAGLHALGDLSLGEALMTQTALSGIGNIYKSETLFVCRSNPFRAVSEFDREQLTRIVRTARELLRKNARPGSSQRTTTTNSGGRYWVYRRSGQACRVCGSRVRMQRQGALHRSTYYCASCQSSP
ncbi:MAG TPA: DNA-formamidopyrimidine glycosylase family protein [Polyangiaceae bacterium]|nr:DNA-formamidopyrimidine glycosylase family protein [Polyangiaceae bacterium]